MTLAFLIALPVLSFRTIVYFLVLTEFLNVLFLAVNLGVVFLTVAFVSLVDLSLLSLSLEAGVFFSFTVTVIVLLSAAYNLYFLQMKL